MIVGCGFAGATVAERIATVMDKKVLIVERRSHIGGNCYDYYNDEGLLVGKYGAHIFHTDSERVWQYVNRFAEFSSYVHTVDAMVGGRFYKIPLNLHSINKFFGLNLSEDELPEFLDRIREPIDRPSNSEEVVVSRVGRELYEAFYKNYTLKQWDVHPRDLEPSVTQRLHIRTNSENRYFLDRYQGMPMGGYTAMFRRMLTNKNITVILNTDYREVAESVMFGAMIFTGPIDMFFDYKLGKLPYRSIDFEFRKFDKEYYQHTGVINYPNDHDYTRIVEYKHLYGQKHPHTVISVEYPCWQDDEPYYPVPMKANRELYAMYQKEAEEIDNVYFCGRLGTYRYLNMDQSIEQALDLFDRILLSATNRKRVHT